MKNVLLIVLLSISNLALADQYFPQCDYQAAAIAKKFSANIQDADIYPAVFIGRFYTNEEIWHMSINKKSYASVNSTLSNFGVYKFACRTHGEFACTCEWTGFEPFYK